jgi:hypothetical protein
MTGELEQGVAAGVQQELLLTVLLFLQGKEMI